MAMNSSPVFNSLFHGRTTRGLLQLLDCRYDISRLKVWSANHYATELLMDANYTFTNINFI
jgi:hypothetical protein